jgi:hypothetical protein
MMQKIIKKEMGAAEFESYSQMPIEPWGENGALFGFQAMVDFWAEFPSGHAPTADEIRITLGTSYHYLPYEWDGTRLTFRGVVGGTLALNDYELNLSDEMTLNEKMVELSSPILKMSVQGLDLEDADDLQVKGVIHVVSACFGFQELN